MREILLYIGVVILTSFFAFMVFITEGNGNSLKKDISQGGCYVCSDNTYIKYEGQDSGEKRQKAFILYKCDVVGRIKECESERVIY